MLNKKKHCSEFQRNKSIEPIDTLNKASFTTRRILFWVWNIQKQNILELASKGLALVNIKRHKPDLSWDFLEHRTFGVG